MLLEARCEVDPLTDGWSPLHNVAYHGTPQKIAQGGCYLEIATLLLKAGASTSICAGGRTAREWADALGNQQIGDVLDAMETECKED